jgi:hypothetical protein
MTAELMMLDMSVTLLATSVSTKAPGFGRGRLGRATDDAAGVLFAHDGVSPWGGSVGKNGTACSEHQNTDEL